MSDSIQFVQPAEILRKYIDYYYFIELSGKSGSEELEQKPISNGCVEMFIGYHDTIGTCYTNNGSTVQMKSAVIGTHELRNSIKGLAMQPESKIFKFASVSFKPDGFFGIFKIPVFEIYNSFIEACDFLGNNIKLLEIQLNDAKDIIERTNYLDQYFISQLKKNSPKTYGLNTGADIVKIINYHKGNIKINLLSQEFKLTERTLQRNLKTLLGLSPKEYCKIIRFKHLFNHVSTNHNIDWLDMVNQFGYYDQAHLINEFKNATGITPDVFVKYKNKNLFKIGNHLVILKPTAVYNNEVYKAMAQASYLEYAE